MQKVKDLFTPDSVKEKRRQSLAEANAAKEPSAEGAEGQPSLQSKGPSAEGAEGQANPSGMPSAEGAEGQTSLLQSKGPSAEGAEGQILPSGGPSAEGSEGQNPVSSPTVGTGTSGGVKDSSGSYGASPGTGISSYTGEEGRLNRDEPSAEASLDRGESSIDPVRRPFAKKSGMSTQVPRGVPTTSDSDGHYEAAAASSALPGSYDVTGTSVMPGTYATTPGTQDAPITNNAPQIGETNAPQIGKPDVGEKFSDKEILQVERPYSEHPIDTAHTTFTGNRLDPRSAELSPFHDEPSSAPHGGVSETAGISAPVGVSETTDTGPASKTVGPHESNLANIVDPRVKPEPEKQTSDAGDITGPASSTIGPHKSNLANIVDPRVKPDPDLMKSDRREELAKDGAIAGGAAAAGGAVAYEAEKHHDSSAAAPSATESTTTAPTTTSSSTAAPTATTDTTTAKDYPTESKTEEPKEKEKKGGILGFLHRDKKPKDKETEDEDSKRDSKAAAVAGTGAAGALAAEELSDKRRRSSAEPYTTEHHVDRELKYDQQTKGGLLGFLHKDQQPKYQDPDEPATTAREKYYGTDGATRPSVSAQGGAVGPAAAAGGAAVGGAAAATAGEELFDHKDPVSSKHTRGSSRHFTDKDYETVPESTEGKSQTHHSIFHHDSVGPNKKHGDEKAAVTGAATGAAVGAAAGSYGNDTYGASAPTGSHHGQGVGGSNEGAIPSGTTSDGYATSWVDEVGASKKSRAGDGLSEVRKPSEAGIAPPSSSKAETSAAPAAAAGAGAAGAAEAVETTGNTGSFGNDTYGASAPTGAHHGQGIGGSNEGPVPSGTTSDGYPTSWIDEVGASKKSLAGDGMLGKDEKGKPSISSETDQPEQKRGLLDKILHRENPNKLHKDPPS